MDTLFAIIITGLAVGYVVELLTSLFERWVTPRVIKLWFTLPLSFGGLWLLGISGNALYVATPAAGFASLAVLVLTSKPVQVINNLRR